MGEEQWDWARRCTGGATHEWCGKQATVVCTEIEPFLHPLMNKKGTAVEELGPFQWYACDEAMHRQSPRDPDAVVETTAIADWAAQVTALIERRERERDKLIAAEVLTDAGGIERGRGRLGFG